MRALALLLLTSVAAAQPTNERPINSFETSSIVVLRNQLGFGSPQAAATADVELGSPVADGYYHVTQYLAGYPTAATIWPRVIGIPCTIVDGKQVCEGLHWRPELGRGEYLFVRPIVKAAPPPPPPVVVPEPPAPVIIYETGSCQVEEPSLDIEPGSGVVVVPEPAPKKVIPIPKKRRAKPKDCK